jgi:FkbM family methyltransferase
MSFLEIKENLKRILQVDRWYFSYINLKYNLNLNFQLNKSQLVIFKEVFYHKAYEIGFPKGIENGVIVDIGAHYGYFSIFASKNIGSQTIIYALEPSPDNFEHLSENMKAAKISHVVPTQIAISGTSTERDFYTAKSWNHSLYENYLDHMKPSTKVKCLTLDDFMSVNKINHIDFLKLDCEGSEHEILQNTNPIIFKKIKTISMEIHDMSHCGFSSDKTMGILKNEGFEILYSDYERKKHKRGFNAKVVLQLKNIN